MGWWAATSQHNIDSTEITLSLTDYKEFISMIIKGSFDATKSQLIMESSTV